jgi:hypothetical protein
MAAYNVCRKASCATLVEGKVDACPKCGGPMRSVGESPARGIVLLLCGLFLAGAMGAIIYYMYPSMMHPGESIDGQRYTGTAEQARLFLTLFLAVFVFGLVAIANGIYMLVTKQQSKVFIFISLGLAAALIILGFVAIGSTKEEDKPVRTYSTY